MLRLQLPENISKPLHENKYTNCSLCEEIFSADKEKCFYFQS